MKPTDGHRFRTARPRAQLRAGRTDWYRVRNADGSRTARVDIYDEVGYWGVTADDLARELAALDCDLIDLHLNTPGGEVFDGITIMNAFRDHPARVVATVDGLAASIGSVILQGADERIMNRGAQLMIHNASGLAIGDSSTMREMADLLDRQNANLAAIYAARAGSTSDAWLAAMAAETWYDADEAVAAGLADTASTDDAVGNSWDLSIFAHAGRTAAGPPPSPPAPPVSNATEATPGGIITSTAGIVRMLKEAAGG